MYSHIANHSALGKRTVSILIDPDKAEKSHLEELFKSAEKCGIDFILIGGSFLYKGRTNETVALAKSLTKIPLIIFPGSAMQVVPGPDALLFLSLISGRNAEYLIGQHVVSAPHIAQSGMEVIPTGYMLIDGGSMTTAQYISQTMPIPSDKPEIAAATALAGMYLGLKMIYMDTGSGAKNPVPIHMIKAVRQHVDLPIWAGGGIKTAAQASELFDAGVSGIVIGTAVEKNVDTMHEIAMAARSLITTA